VLERSLDAFVPPLERPTKTDCSWTHYVGSPVCDVLSDTVRTPILEVVRVSGFTNHPTGGHHLLRGTVSA
jgi:hypothetical protein